ncbi:MAG: DUF2892 domain-containing protein [Hyphomicrobiales bacterium]|nr:DUF2892 domain-containing protein [Alphaproteobacteria bacterium]
MFYQKNLALWERTVRVVAALAMIACGLIGLQGLAIGYLIAAAGVFVAVTGVFGYCPACAMAGRRLTKAE